MLNIYQRRKMNNWIHLPFNIGDYQGFVYIIEDIDTKMKYIGKKNFWKKIRRKPLKGKKRVRLDKVESDWETYNSSNKILQEKITKNPYNFIKKIVKLCESKQDMAIYETYIQLQEYLNGNWDMLYNEVINIRCRVRKEKGDKI